MYFKALPFSPIKIDNSLILYIFISLAYQKISFALSLFFYYSCLLSCPGKPFNIRVSWAYCLFLILSPYFALTDTLPLKNGTFLTKIPSPQNLKVAIYKVFSIFGR